MKTILKYELEITDFQQIEMPKYAKILTVQMQQGKMYIWVEVLTTAFTEFRQFWLFGTGHEINTGIVDIKYVGTFQMQSGFLVFHLYTSQTYPNQ